MPEGLKLSGLPFEMVIFNKHGKTFFQLKIQTMGGQDLIKIQEKNVNW